HPNTGEGSKVDLPALHPGHQWSWRFLLFAGGALLVALILAAIPIGKAGRRRVARARAKAPDSRGLGATGAWQFNPAGFGCGASGRAGGWADRHPRGSDRQPGLPAGVPQGPQELIAVPTELGHLVGDLAGALVDGHEESHLALAQRVQDLALPANHLEDRLPVGHQLDLGKMVVEPGLPVQVLPGATDPLEGHPPVEE